MYSGVSPSLRLHRQRPQALLPQQSLYETTYIRPSSGVGFSAAEAPRAMGSRGSTDAPINIDPSEPRKLRRDVRRAIARADPSVNASNQLMDCLRTHDHAA